jgi:hypothetical protein
MKLWPFRRPKPVEPTRFDDAALDRAIRAGVLIPFEWFIHQPEEVQETIALRRDAYLEDLILTVGYAVLDPERMRLGLMAEDGDEKAGEELEELNLKTLADVVARRAAQGGSSGPLPPSDPSMGGFGKRRSEAAAKSEAASRIPTPFGGKGVAS